jgi:hypothetical protein
MADRLLAQLAASEPDSILPVDFGKVHFMDFSCADELMTRVLRRIRSGELGTRFILLQDLSPSVEENLAAVCAIRDLVCPKRTTGGKIELLGKIGPELAETYHLAVRKGTITARDVAAIACRSRKPIPGDSARPSVTCGCENSVRRAPELTCNEGGPPNFLGEQR